MNILFLIGNGFDLNLGLNTKYKDFNKYYTSIKSDNDVVNKLKDVIDDNIENWSDMELELGEYTKYLKSEEEFIIVYEDICDRLADYLQEEEAKFDFKNINAKKLNSYFSYPSRSLPPADRNIANNYINTLNGSQWNIDIVTFNYTRSLEKLLDYSGATMNLGTYKGKPIVLQKIEHIHGYLNDRMVLGVNDISQISNSNFHKNENVLMDLIKNNCNQAQKHLTDSWSKIKISNANLICIFGSSIGDSDNMWWELIGERLKDDCFLLIFEKGEVISPRRPQRKLRLEIEKKNYFLGKTKLNNEEKNKVADKIIVGINTDLFDLKLKK